MQSEDQEREEELSRARACLHERLHKRTFECFRKAMDRDVKHRFWTTFSSNVEDLASQSDVHGAPTFSCEIRFTIQLNMECRTPETTDLIAWLVDQIVHDMQECMSGDGDSSMRIAGREVQYDSRNRSADVTMRVRVIDR